MNPLLEISNLSVVYDSGKKSEFRAVNGVSLDIARGETLAVVGESGSGKTTLGRAILGLAPVTTGAIRFDGEDISHLSPARRRRLAAKLQVVFQDPYSSINPAMTTGEILSEPLRVHGWSKNDATKRIKELLSAVHLPANSFDRKAREYSGGQRQRIAIARALALSPKLVICDEPVSALDLTTQARILALFKEIQQSTEVSYLFISHDLSVVNSLSDKICVMYKGEIVESGSAKLVMSEPQNSYSKKLLLASPLPDPTLQRARREERQKLLSAGLV